MKENTKSVWERQDIVIGEDGVCRIPDGIREVPAKTFAYNRRLRQVILPDTIEQLGPQAFLGCESLHKINLPASLRSIGSSCFAQCSALRGIDLPEGLEEVGSKAFSYCESLTAFRVPETVRKLGHMPLYLCEDSVKFTLPDHLRKRNLTPRQQLGLTDENDQLVVDGTLYYTPSVDSNIPEGVRRIAVDAFPVLHSFGHAEIECTLPSTLEVIYRNKIFNNRSRAGMLPPAYFTYPIVLPGKPNLALLKGRLAAEGSHIPEVAAILLAQKSVFLPIIRSTMLQAPPHEVGERLLTCLADPRFRSLRTSLPRAAMFYFLYSDQLAPDYSGRLGALFTNETAPGPGGWRQSLLDTVLTEVGLDPGSPAFSEVFLADSSKCADPQQVKEALVPYLAQGIWLSESEAWGEARCLPDADKAARSLDRASLQAALPQILGEAQFGNVQQLPAFLRYAGDEDVQAVIQQHKAHCRWARGGTRPQCSYRATCRAVKNGLLLSDSGYATEFIAGRVCGCEIRPGSTDATSMLTKYVQRQAAEDVETDMLFPAHMQVDSYGTRRFETADGSGKLAIILIRDAFRYLNVKAARFVKTIPKAMESMRAEIQAAKRQIGGYYDAFYRWMDTELNDIFLTGRTVRPEIWKRFLSSPMLATLASGIVWQQGELSFFVNRGGAWDASRNAVTLDPDQGITLATSSSLPDPLLRQWRNTDMGTASESLLLQLEAPHYEPAMIDPDRFLGCPIDRWALKFEAKGRLTSKQYEAGWPLGALGYLEESDDPKYGPLCGKIVLAESPKIDAAAHHALFYLDCLTFAERLRRDDPSLISFLTGLGKREYRSYIEMVLKADAPIVRAGALNAGEQHSKLDTGDFLI